MAPRQLTCGLTPTTICAAISSGAIGVTAAPILIRASPAAIRSGAMLRRYLWRAVLAQARADAAGALASDAAPDPNAVPFRCHRGACHLHRNAFRHHRSGSRVQPFKAQRVTRATEPNCRRPNCHGTPVARGPADECAQPVRPRNPALQESPNPSWHHRHREHRP